MRFFALQCLAWEVLSKRWKPGSGPKLSVTDGDCRSIDSSQLTLLGQTPDANGFIYLELPEDELIEVVPTIRNAAFYAFEVWPSLLLSACESPVPADRDRTTVGVGEEVLIAFWPPLPDEEARLIRWRVEDGGDVTPQGGNFTRFTAPDSARTCTVIADTPGEDGRIAFDAREPEGIAYARIAGALPLAAGIVGAGMSLDVFVGPTSVSFYRVEIMEVPGPASNPNGYFLIYPPPTHNEQAGAGRWIELLGNNYWRDIASGHGYVPSGPGPSWPLGGSYTWQIPAWWRIKGTTSAGKAMQGWNQVITLCENGTVQVDKFGQWLRQARTGVIQHSQQ